MMETSTPCTLSPHPSSLGRRRARRRAGPRVPSPALLLSFCAVLLLSSTVHGFISTPHTTSLKYSPGFPTRSLALPPRASTRRARGDAQVLLEPPMRYNSEGWFYDLISLPRSKIVKNIRTHLAANTAWALLIGLIHETSSMELHVSPLPHTLITAALGLLLVFRTNASYARFWEARIVWGSITNTCRNLARTAYTALDRRYHARFAQLVAAFPLVLKAHLQCIEQGRELDLLLGPVEAQEIRLDPNPPAAIANKMTQLVVNAINSQQQQRAPVGAASRFRGATLAPQPEMGPRQGLGGNMLDVQFLSLHNLIGELVNCLGMCERILMTPIPPSYSRHTSRLLSIYCLTLPFVLVEQLDMFMVPATVALCWGLFSIEEIGHYIEEPFRNQLPLDRFVKNIRGDVERMMMVNVVPAVDARPPPDAGKSLMGLDEKVGGIKMIPGGPGPRVDMHFGAAIADGHERPVESSSSGLAWTPQ